MEQPEWCPTPRPIYRQRLGATTGRKAVAPCGTLPCPYCGPLIRREKAGHYANALGKRGDVIYVVTVDDRNWVAYRTRVRRSGDYYVCCPTKGGTNTVFTTMAGGKPVSEGLELMVLDALMAIPLRDGRIGRSVSASTAVRPPKWRGLDDLRTFPLASGSHFDAAAERLGIVLKIQRAADGSQTVAEVEAPEIGDPEFVLHAAHLGIVIDRGVPCQPLKLRGGETGTGTGAEAEG